MKVAIVGNDLRCTSLARVLDAEGWEVTVVPGPLGSSLPPGIRSVALPEHPFPWHQMRLRTDISRAIRVISPDLVVCLHVESSDAGVVDELRRSSRTKSGGFEVFGVGRECASLELSKAVGLSFARSAELAVPSSVVIPAHKRRVQVTPTGRCVLKADGLAGGRGTVIIEHPGDLTHHLVQAPAGDVVLQEFVEGEEFALSLLVSPGGVDLLNVNFEYKRERDGDIGDNTPGMGTVAWNVEWREVAAALLKALPERLREIDYQGPLDVNFIIDRERRPVFLEFTCRFGDPELSSELLLLSEVGRMLMANCRRRRDIRRRRGAIWAAGVVAQGRPRASLHSSHKHSVLEWTANEYRVHYCASAAGPSHQVALRRCYQLLEREAPLEYRRDIGHDVQRRLTSLKALIQLET